MCENAHVLGGIENSSATISSVASSYVFNVKCNYFMTAAFTGKEGSQDRRPKKKKRKRARGRKREMSASRFAGFSSVSLLVPALSVLSPV